jgi:hypothetical protein
MRGKTDWMEASTFDGNGEAVCALAGAAKSDAAIRSFAINFI